MAKATSSRYLLKYMAILDGLQRKICCAEGKRLYELRSELSVDQQPYENDHGDLHYCVYWVWTRRLQYQSAA